MVNKQKAFFEKQRQERALRPVDPPLEEIDATKSLDYLALASVISTRLDKRKLGKSKEKREAKRQKYATDASPTQATGDFCSRTLSPLSLLEEKEDIYVTPTLETINQSMYLPCFISGYSHIQHLSIVYRVRSTLM